MKKKLSVLAMAAMLVVGAQFVFAADQMAKKAGEPRAIMVETVKGMAKDPGLTLWMQRNAL